jgi:hypothetical protein
MTSPNAPRVPAASPASAQTAWLADAELAEVDGVAAPAWADWSLAHAASDADETTMNSPCL